jgi:hypothetical protein
MRFHALAAASAVISLALCAWTADAWGETTAPPPPPPATGSPEVQPILGERTTHQPPNGPLLIGGLIAFGGSYIPSVIVAAEANTSFDNFLYIPIVGPWLDLANRPQCGGRLQPACSTEWGRKAILVANGIIQAAGATAIVLGIVLPGRHSELVTAKLGRAQELRMNIVPSQVSADGFGLTAIGDF